MTSGSGAGLVECRKGAATRRTNRALSQHSTADYLVTGHERHPHTTPVAPVVHRDLPMAPAIRTSTCPDSHGRQRRDFARRVSSSTVRP